MCSVASVASQVSLEESAFLALGGGSLASLASGLRMAAGAGGQAGGADRSVPNSPADSAPSTLDRSSVGSTSLSPAGSLPGPPGGVVRRLTPAGAGGAGAAEPTAEGRSSVREALLPRCSEGNSSFTGSEGRYSRNTQ